MKNISNTSATPGRYFKNAIAILSVILLFQGVGYAQGKTVSKADSTILARADSIKKVIDKCDSCKADVQKAVTGNNVFVGDAIAVGVVCIIVCILLIYFARKSPKSGTDALGLPAGSVRAIIAILLILFYVLLSIAFSIFGGSAPSPIGVDVTKTMGTLLVAISAFYFGSKTAEQSSKSATENLTNALKNQAAPGKTVPAPDTPEDTKPAE